MTASTHNQADHLWSTTQFLVTTLLIAFFSAINLKIGYNVIPSASPQLEKLYRMSFQTRKKLKEKQSSNTKLLSLLVPEFVKERLEKGKRRP